MFYTEFVEIFERVTSLRNPRALFGAPFAKVAEMFAALKNMRVAFSGPFAEPFERLLADPFGVSLGAWFEHAYLPKSTIR